MKNLSKFWLRLLLSIIAGIIIAEGVIASTGTGLYKPFLVCIWIGIIYAGLTGIVLVYNWNHAKSEK